MSSERYLEWCTVHNTVKSRLKNNSLAHTFSSEKRIRKSTKLINKIFEQKLCKNTYADFKQRKEKILQQLAEKATENIDVIDKSDVNDTYYKSFYDSFNVTLSNLRTEEFSWHYIEKKGKDQTESEETTLFPIWEPKVEDINIIKTHDDFEKMCSVNKIRKKDQTIESVTKSATESKKSYKKEEATPTNVKKFKSTINSVSSSNKKSSVNEVKSKVTKRKNTSAKEKQSPKSKQLSKKCSKDVKKNLTVALDNASLVSQELAGEEWNDDFTEAEFQAQSTQIFSNTFAEKIKSRPSIDHKLSHEVINQPRDSGIEEDSREDNLKFGNPVEKVCNKNGNDEENLSLNEVKRTPSKKVPLKIIGEEKVTKKIKIINNKNKEPEEQKKEEYLKSEAGTNEKSESSSESDSEFADCQIANDSQCNKSDRDSSDEYYDLQDNEDNSNEEDSVDIQNDESKRESEGSQSDNENKNILQNDNSKRDFEGSQNDFENKNVLENDDSKRYFEDSQIDNENENVSQNDEDKRDSEDTENDHESKNNDYDRNSVNEIMIDKKDLKDRLKNCRSPFMIRRYNDLKRSRVLDESDIEPEIKKNKNKSEKTLITPSKSSKSKKTNRLKVASLKDVPELQKQVNEDESFEEKTLIAENFNDYSVLTNGLKENVKGIEDGTEATPNIAKLEQIKKPNLLSKNDALDDSEIEYTNKTMDKESMKSSKRKQFEQKMKKVDMLSTERSENESEHTAVNEDTLSDTQIEKTISSKKENVQNVSNSNKADTDSIVSETTNSQTSSKSRKYNEKQGKHKVPIKLLADKDASSAHEGSVEIDTQSDLKKVVNNYKQSLLSQTPKLTKNLNESVEPSDIGIKSKETPINEDQDSDDSENSEAEKTVVTMKNQSAIQDKESSDSGEKDGSIKNVSSKVAKTNQKAMVLKESSSEEDLSDSEELKDFTIEANLNKNEDSEDECTMSSQAKQNLSKIKRLDLLNSDEDSDESEDGIAEKNTCNSDVDIEEHKVEETLSSDDSQRKNKVSLSQLKEDYNSSDKSDSETSTASKSNKSKNKHSSSGFTNFKNSEVFSSNTDNNSKNKNKHKRKFAQIDSEDMHSEQSGTSLEIDVVDYSSENNVSDQRKFKKAKSSNLRASTIDEEDNSENLSTNSLKFTEVNTALSENDSDDSDADQVMSHSSKQKILRLQKMNLLANNSSSSSEDEKPDENSLKTLKKNHKKKATNKSELSNSDSDSDSEKKNDLHDINTKVSNMKNQVKEIEEDVKDNENDVEHKNYAYLDDRNDKSEDSEEECTMSSKTKERLNKMKRLDLFNNDEDSDDSNDGIKDNSCNSDIDIEEHKIEDVDPKYDLNKDNDKLKSPINSSFSDSKNADVDRSKAKASKSVEETLLHENTKENEIISKKSSKLASRSISPNSTEVNNSFENEKHERKKSKNSKKKNVTNEPEDNVNLQKSTVESQPMFSSLEDLREGIDEKQINIDIESVVNSNTDKESTHISPAEVVQKNVVDKVTKISQLVEKESLEKITCQSSMNINNISADEEIFVLEVPRTIFNENLVGKPLSFSKTTLTVGNNKYEAFQKQVSPTYSCVFKTEKKALDSFVTQNIRPVATIVARRRKLNDEFTNNSDNEVDEDIHEFSTLNETKNLSNGDIPLKFKSPKTKVTKKTKRSKKSEEKDIVESTKRPDEEELKMLKSKKKIIDVDKNVKTTSKATTSDNSEKRSEKLKKAQHRTDFLNDDDEITRHENLYTDNPSYVPIDAHTQALVKKAVKDPVNNSTPQDISSKKPVKSPDKSKKSKRPTEVANELEDVKVSDKKSTEPVKKKSESKPLTKKRKPEVQMNEVANPDENEGTKKKTKTAKKEKPASKVVKPRGSKKKSGKEAGESAAEQIKKLIAKSIKFNDSLNDVFDPSNYDPLDVKRIPKKAKRCQSTTSSSSDDEDSKLKRPSFHVRSRTKSEDDKSPVKKEDKKSVKKVFFAE